MKRATVLAHDYLAAVLSPGDLAVDATLGNGHDALFLAELVGEKGRLIGFDIQAQAIESSQARLMQAGVFERCQLVEASHTEMATYVSGEVAAVTFNLGYLPGADQAMITEPRSTLEALKASLSLLRPGGLITCVCYPGHPGGLDESELVLAWAERLSEESHRVEFHNEKGRHEGRPFLVSIWRLEAT
ncbi:methyltransferase domain-containing protein [Akkermansiaceae bacterium]|jgi:predicted O-methyltransferase YrrM|nr:methyltransferase domain-containing protein [Akkermansiaceae bacterium]MDA7888398.1 methyltransferase domain-containing protein [Akkermansiaceae bacterium]